MSAPEPHAPDASPCVQCGQALPAGFTGPSCPACLLLGAGAGATGEIDGELTVAMGVSDPGAAAPEEVIGPYRLVELLGEGGFGTVWRAEQSEPIRREVALKLIKPGMDSREVVARFEAERQALALMEHPNIAGVLDAGTTAAGRPYFVMELVRGLPITRYCDEKRLTVRERLELFIPVCQAVQHAHQKAVLHRDLKPSNILVAEVDGRAVPKVIDFGIAKALGNTPEEALHVSLARTVEGMVIGTPQYMSPEQAGATRDLDTRSDVYTLGVILYELLTGRTPLRREELGKAGFEEMLRLIRERESVRPSSRLAPVSEVVRETSTQRGTEPGKLRRQLSGDLDWIVLRALEKERERRYGSAAELAADIQRHLGNEPVEAGPPSALYRLRKLAGRHRVAFAAGVAVTLSLLAGIGLSTWQAVRATRAERLAEENYLRAEEQRKRADEEAAVAREVNEFLQNDMLRQAGSRAQADGGSEVDPNLTVRQALERAAERIGGRFGGRPLVEAEIRHTIGVACREVGDHVRSIEQLEAALALRKQWLGENHPNTLNSMNSLAVAYGYAGRLDDALLLFEQTLELQRATLGQEHPETLNSMNSLAMAYESAGRLDEALPLAEQTFQLHHAKLGPEHPNTLNSMNNLAMAYGSAGRFHDALPLYKQTLELLTVTLGPEHPDTLILMSNLAGAYQSAGRLDDALPLYEQTLEVRKVTLGPEHPETLNSMNSLAKAYESAGRLDEALPLAEQTFQLHHAKLGPKHPNTLNSMNSLAMAYKSAGRLHEALPLYEQTLELRKSTLGPEHPDTLGSMNNLAVAYKSAGRLHEALPLYEQTLELRKSTLGQEHPDTLASMNNLAVAYKSAGRLDEALPLYEQTLEIRKAKLGPDHPDTLGSMNNLAGAYEFAGRLDQALSLHEQTLEIRKAKLGPDHPDTLVSMNNLAGAYKSAGRLDEALPLYEKTLELQKAKLGLEHPNTLESMNDLGRAYQSVGRLDEAEALFREGLERSRQKNAARPDSDPSSEGVFLHHLADLLRQKNELDEARQLAEEAVTLYQLHPGLPVNEIRHAWNVLASLQEAQGDPEGAKNSRREALRIQKPAAR